MQVADNRGKDSVERMIPTVKWKERTEKHDPTFGNLKSTLKKLKNFIKFKNILSSKNLLLGSILVANVILNSSKRLI